MTHKNEIINEFEMNKNAKDRHQVKLRKTSNA